MSWRSDVRARARSLLFRSREERELAEEMRFHLEMEEQANLRRGMAPAEARRRARLTFGGEERFKEEVRDARGIRLLGDLAEDVRYALRGLRRTPGFTLTALAVLAVGIGGNATLFTGIRSILLRPMPGVEPDASRVWITPMVDGRNRPLSYPEYEDARALNGVFEATTVFGHAMMAVATRGPAERVGGGLVSPGFFRFFGVQPILGRGFLPEEERIEHSAVAVLSERLWRERFGGDPRALGGRIMVDGHPFTVVGVVPAEFSGVEAEDALAIWLPIAAQSILTPGAPDMLSRKASWLAAAGRLRPGVSREEVNAALEVVAGRQEAAFPGEHYTVRAYPMRSGVQPGAAAQVTPIFALGGAVTLLLLIIACSNFATLLIGRAASRRAELVVRQTLGAGRGRIVRLLLTEVLVLTLVAGTLGLLLAVWVSTLLTRTLANQGARLVLHPDASVAAATLALALVTGIVFGLAPALQATRVNGAEALRERDPHGGRRASRLRRALVVAQIGLSLLLLVTSGLFLRSLGKALSADLGFDARDNVLAASYDLVLQGYAPERRQAFDDELLRRVGSLPGVESASLADDVPLGGIIFGNQVQLEGEAADARATSAMIANVRPGFFHALGIPLHRGRDFARTDDAGAPPVAIVSESFARQRFPGQSPIGKRLRVGSSDAPLREIVAVAGDATYDGIGREPRPLVYVPLAQRAGGLDQQTLVLRVSHGSAIALTEPLLGMFAELDPNLPVFRVATMGEHVRRSVQERRIGTWLLALVGALALLLSAVGLYGLTAYSAAQRRYEVGVRMAIGAGRPDVLRLFVGEGVRLAAVGVGIGLVLAVALTRLLGGMLLGITPLDVATFAGVAALLAGVALLASYLPARRAAGTDPVRVLRAE